VLALLIVILALGAWISFVISWAQLASFFINYIGAGYLDNPDPNFWNTGNFWAWVITIILLAVVICLIKLVAVGTNRLLILAVYFVSGANYAALSQVRIASVVIQIFWLIFSIFTAITLLQFFASYPELTDWFRESNWFAGILLGISTYTLTSRFKFSEDD